MKTYDYEEPVERVGYDFGLNRRNFVQILGAGLLVAVGSSTALGQRAGRGSFGGTGAKSLAARR